MLLSITVAVLLGLAAIVYLWARHRNSYWDGTNVPHVTGVPFFGNFWPIVTMHTGVVQHFQAMYNDARVRDAPAFGMYMFCYPALFLSDPELIRQVMVRDFAQFTDRYSHSGAHDPIGNLNILFARGGLWRRLRTRLTPFFSSGKLRQMFSLVSDVGRELDARLSAMPLDGAKVDGDRSSMEMEAKDFAARYTTDVIASCAYGVQANSLADPDSDFRRNGRRVFTFNFYRMLEVTALYFLPEVTGFFKFRLFGVETSDFFKRTIAYVMGEREKSQIQRNDLIDTLIQLKNEDKDRVIEGDDFRFNGDILVAQATIFFTAGFETSSSTISFGLYELSQHPDVQKRLRAEIKQTLLKNDGQLTYDSIKEMVYMHMVVSEILRMHPIMPYVDRRATLSAGQKTYSFRPYVDYEMPDAFGVIVPIAAIQRDAKYFPDPDRFDPERFAPENRANIMPYTFMPFGVGPRGCIGERFGWMQSKVGFASFLRNHYVTASSKMSGPLEYSRKSMFLQTEKGIYVNVVRDPLIVE